MTIDWQGEKWVFDIGMLDIRWDFVFLAKTYGLGFEVLKPA